MTDFGGVEPLVGRAMRIQRIDGRFDCKAGNFKSAEAA